MDIRKNDKKKIIIRRIRIMNERKIKETYI